jgi:hypothetical protein
MMVSQTNSSQQGLMQTLNERAAEPQLTVTGTDLTEPEAVQSIIEVSYELLHLVCDISFDFM